MFKERLITGLILAIVGYYLITIASQTTFLLVQGLILVIVSLEWSKLIQFNSVIQKVTMLLLLLLGVGFFAFIPFSLFSVLVTLWWCFAIYWIMAYQKDKILWSSQPTVLVLLGIFLIAPLFVSAYHLKVFDENESSRTLLFVVMVIMICDVMAYFVGKTMGNHLLVSRVSPKKTWEGIIGGMLASGLLAVPIAYWCGVTKTVNPWMILPAVIIAGISVVGDLTESVCKRNAGIKDSGNILPGHGGLLDRFDSYMAGIPIAYLLLSYFM